jgi:predicted transposase YdaD
MGGDRRWHWISGARPRSFLPLTAPLPSDHWYSEVFRALPDLVCHLLPGLAASTGDTGIPAAANSAADSIPSSGPSPSSSFEPGTDPERETTYIFRPVALKKVTHHPDGVLWPRQNPGGSEARPVVILEVQMHPDRRFHRRLAAETFRLLQQHEEVAHLRVLVLLAHRHLALGSSQPLLLRRFLEHDVIWVDLQALARRSDLDPQLALLTLPVQKEPDLGSCARRILALRPDLMELILPILSERFQGLSPSQIMATLGISKDFWRHTRAFQDILAEGRQEGLREGVEEGRRREASALALRLLERRCGSLSATTTARIEALNLARLEELALALLDFRGAEDLRAWLEL